MKRYIKSSYGEDNFEEAFESIQDDISNFIESNGPTSYEDLKNLTSRKVRKYFNESNLGMRSEEDVVDSLMDNFESYGWIEGCV